MDFPFLVSAEDNEALEATLNTLDNLWKSERGPFPYDDIRRIYKTVASRKKLTRRVMDKGFVPDLDMYLSDIAGCSSWGRKALGWDAEKRELFAHLMSQEFFERHPEYLLVRRWITEVNTPELYGDFILHEEMRVNVLALIRLLDKLEGR